MLSLCALFALQSASASITTEQDYRETLSMLGLERLRPGADGMNPNAPNAANRDESKAEIYGNYPPLLVNANGKALRSIRDWERHRATLLELFEREVYGRTPKKIPAVKWTIRDEVESREGEIEVLRQFVVGTVDNRQFPTISVEIPFVLVTPKQRRGKVPVIMEFAYGRLPSNAAPPSIRPSEAGAPTANVKSWTLQVLERGYGYALLYPYAYQADNGAGLRSGIIGLVNQGKSRKPDDWGALKAWAWGASRALDFLNKHSSTDGRRVAIEGLSRFGKAALVTMATDPRFAAALVGSSGAGGAKLWRRNFGEQEGNIASSGEYHWMAPNFLKYAGPKNPSDLPVDSHQLIALCAPRPTFIGVGSPNVEGTWVDATGMYRATVMATPAWEIYGKRGIPTGQFPVEETSLLDGELGFRQHAGGHTNGPNWPYFLEWVSRYF